MPRPVIADLECCKDWNLLKFSWTTTPVKNSISRYAANKLSMEYSETPEALPDYTQVMFSNFPYAFWDTVPQATKEYEQNRNICGA